MEIDWASFTPWSSLAGGLLIGLAAAILALANGRVAGISGIVAGLLQPVGSMAGWRVAFVLGLVLAPLAFWLVRGQAPGAPPTAGTGVLVVAGLLVGIGTRIGGGCTSGHGVCGLARFSPRSLVATLTFMGTAIGVVLLTRQVL